MTTKRKRPRIAKGPNIIAREKVKKELKAIGALVKRLVIKTQHPAFSVQDFGRVLAVGRLIDDAMAQIGV